MKALLVVTGASKGLGRSIALAFAHRTAITKIIDDETDNSKGDDITKNPPRPRTEVTNPINITSLRTLLLARSKDGLAETKRLMGVPSQSCGENDPHGDQEVTIHPIDLSDLDNLGDAMNRILDEATGDDNDSPSFDHCILINNAGTVGPLGTSNDPNLSLSNIRKSMDLNVTSSVWISSLFVKRFGKNSSVSNQCFRQQRCTVVNISSLCALEPFSSMSVYCMGKAARDMFHTVLAKEEGVRQVGKDSDNDDKANKNEEESECSPIIKILNYAPGPLETEMTNEMVGSASLDRKLHDYFSTSIKEKTLVQTENTAERLVRLVLGEEKFESGSHVDYFDNIES